MKNLKETRAVGEDTSLFDQAMNTKPEFASREEAIEAYTARLEAHGKKCGRSISEMLTKAEKSAQFDEECEEAMDLWRTISSLKRKTHG